MLVHLCICLWVCRMDVSAGYIQGFTIFNFIVPNTKRGQQCDIRGVQGGRGYPSSQMSIILDIFWALL